MTLDMAKQGQTLVIKKIVREDIRSQAMRLGVYEGALLDCMETIKNGPVVLRNAFCEIAIGNKIAKHIFIDIT